MSRILYLLRHGQAMSAYEHGVQADRARELSAQGRQEILNLAQRLQAQADFAPQLALVSSAVRTQQTAQCLSLPGFRLQDDFYNADPKTLLDGLAGAHESIQSALIVAHNPGISWLAASLLRPISSPGFSPGSLLAITLDTGWADIKAGDGRLLWRLDPPEYAANLSQQR